MSMFKDLDRLLQRFSEESVPGCSLHISQGEKILYEGYFGYADLETHAPVTKDSVFRLASMSKIPLYICLMILYERGKFLLTDPIYTYFPEWKNSKKFIKNPNGYVETVPTERPITISDIASMKCGLPYCNSPAPSEDPTLTAMQKHMAPLWEKGHYTLREQIAAMAEAPLAFEPGTHWLYGFSSELAAGLLEAVCDMSVDDVFQELLFDPLEMDNTRSHFFGDIQKRMVTLYGKSPDGVFTPTYFPGEETFQPGAEHEKGWARLFSTGSDYIKFMQMLANGGVYKGRRIIGRKTIDLMRSNGLTPGQLKDFSDPYNAGYGYGYGVRTLIDKEKGNHNGSLGAFGWTGAFGTWCEADPAEQVAIVYMHNMIPNEEKQHHLRVRAAAYGCIE